MKYNIIIKNEDDERFYFCFKDIDDVFSFIKLVLKSSNYIFSIISQK